MKKILFFVSVLFVSLFGCLTVHASDSEYIWHIDGVEYKYGDKSSDGTISYTDVLNDNYDIGVLTLNNYDGSTLVLECRGKCNGEIIPIKLVGENKITNGSGAGIIGQNEFQFVGDGILTISALHPIHKDLSLNYNKTTTSITMTIVGNGKNNAAVGSLENNKKCESDDFNSMFVAFVVIGMFGGTFMVISVILIIELAKANNKLKNSTESSKTSKKKSK